MDSFQLSLLRLINNVKEIVNIQCKTKLLSVNVLMCINKLKQLKNNTCMNALNK